MESRLRELARFAWTILAPVLLCGCAYLLLRVPLEWWLRGEEIYDEEAIKEWVRESRVGVKTLPELLRELLQAAEQTHAVLTRPGGENANPGPYEAKRTEVQEILKAMGAPPTKVYKDQLPLFPLIYRMEVMFDPNLKDRFDRRLRFDSIVWDSDIPRHEGQARRLSSYSLPGEEGVVVRVEYNLHAYLQRQYKERVEADRWLQVYGGLFFLATLGVIWIYLNQRRERERERQRRLAEQKVHEAERKRLEEELLRQEAERKHEEAERVNLELKSQMFANISITAGSYAHNIKNLLVRPNDLLRRCLEESPGKADEARMLAEVKQTLGTVTERLQQILQTVRRDPSKAERVQIDLNYLARAIHQTWTEMARDKWKLVIELDLAPAPVWIEGDLSHLEQVLENLLFNARDATFEMRNHLREQARKEPAAATDAARRQALIAAAGWKGQVTIRTRREDGQAVLEVQDNGIGMAEEVRRRCTEAYFSTKRSALYAGMSAGMGVGLSFVTVILEHHQAKLEIVSQPFQGALFRLRFPAAHPSEGG
jgi:two-component system, cell cycle sensor histidine kinase and response regulator CckA